MSKKVSILGRIIGTPETVSLEDRIFNAFSFIMIFGAVPPILGALATKSHPAVLGSLIMMPLLGAFFYYLARFRGAARKVQVPYLVFILAFATFQWFFHGGLMGGPPIAHLGILVVSLIVVDTRLHFRVVVVAILATALTYIVELRFAELVIHLPTEKERHIDLLALFIPMLVAVGIAMNRLKKEYDNEKQVIEEKNRRLAESEQELLAAKSETDNILLSINEGLLLVDGEHKIGTQHSRALEAIFPDMSTVDRDFPAFIAGLGERIPAAEIADYLKLLFSGKLKDAKAARLNPLEEIALRVGDQDKELQFRFNRIRSGGEIRFLLVVMTDVTESNRIAREAETARKLQDSRTELVYSILQVDSQVLAQFLDDSEQALDRMGESLRDEAIRRDHIAVLELLYREIHNMKGNAGLLQLRALEQLCHIQESRLKEVYDMSERDGRDFLQSILGLQDLRTALEEVRRSMEKIQNYSSARRISPDMVLRDALKQLVERVAADEGREAELEIHGLELTRDFKEVRLLKDVLIQLARNSVVHGIEAPEERLKRGKPRAGVVRVELSSRDGVLGAIVQDDGGGIDLVALREKARAMGKVGDPESLSDAETAKLIFESGMTTRAEASLHGGRGVGLDYVKRELTAVGGGITAEFTPGKMTRFKLTLPA